MRRPRVNGWRRTSESAAEDTAYAIFHCILRPSLNGSSW